METGSNKKWIAIVYDGTDKIASRELSGNNEEDVQVLAKEWVESYHGIERDWSLHHICEK